VPRTTIDHSGNYINEQEDKMTITELITEEKRKADEFEAQQRKEREELAAKMAEELGDA